jgi:hypothetical protein
VQKDDKWDPDEIPGITSYIYKEHRFREPHEFVNYWKVEKQAPELLKKLGLAPDTPISELCKIVQRTQHNLDEQLDVVYDQSLEIDELRTKTYDQENEIKGWKKKTEGTVEQLEAANSQISNLKQMLKTYGTHSGECNWVIMLQSGRLHGTEEEACDCGWNEKNF